MWDVQSGGADGTTGNGGGFDPTNANMATDLAATSGTTTAPVVSSASYNFASRDIGHWLFIKSGTNWNPGWYLITSVNANAATLRATASTANADGTYTTTSNSWVNYTSLHPGTVNGCVTASYVSGTASGTWSIDYSQNNTAGIAYTDAVVGGTTTQYTSTLNPVGPNVVGNIFAVASGGTVQRAQIVSVSGTTATCDKSLGTAAQTCVGNLGGRLATPGQANGLMVASNYLWGSGSFTTSASASVAGGTLAFAGKNLCFVIGYSTVRGDDGAYLTLLANANSASLVNAGTSTTVFVRNVRCGNNGAFTSVVGFTTTASGGFLARCKADSISTGFTTNGSFLEDCFADACTSIAFTNLTSFGRYNRCVSRGNTGGAGFISAVSASWTDCISTGNAGQGYNLTGNTITCINCLAVGNTGASGHGFVTTGIANLLVNCRSENNAQKSYSWTAAETGSIVVNCSEWLTGGGVTHNINLAVVQNFISLTLDPSVNASGGDFSLNDTVGGGRSLRALGVPAAFRGISTTSYPDVGPVQRLVTTSSPAVFMGRL